MLRAALLLSPKFFTLFSLQLICSVLLWLSGLEVGKIGILPFTTSHGEDGSRPQGPLYPRNNTKVVDYTLSELHYNTTVPDAMEI